MSFVPLVTRACGFEVPSATQVIGSSGTGEGRFPSTMRRARWSISVEGEEPQCPDAGGVQQRGQADERFVGMLAGRVALALAELALSGLVQDGAVKSAWSAHREP